MVVPSTAIDSVLSQQGVDAEIIVIDDRSTDHTPEILRSYKGGIHALRQENPGAAAARNLGVQQARGECLLFLDADDQLQPHALLSRLNYLRQHPEVAGWSAGSISMSRER